MKRRPSPKSQPRLRPAHAGQQDPPDLRGLLDLQDPPGLRDLLGLQDLRDPLGLKGLPDLQAEPVQPDLKDLRGLLDLQDPPGRVVKQALQAPPARQRRS
jgi:hypothetical protein